MLLMAWFLLQVKQLKQISFTRIPTISVSAVVHKLFFVFYRHVLASLHFNENVRRERKKTKDGSTYVNVTYPKYKNGGDVVREVAVAETYGM